MPESSSVRTGRRTLGALLGAAVVFAAPAAASLSPDHVLSSALDNARTQHSVHYVTTASSATVDVRMVCDAARDRGIQRITFHKAGQTGQATVLVVAKVAYLRGDQFALINYFGFSASVAKRHAGRWLKIASSSPSYATVSAAVRLNSMLKELALAKPLTRLPQSTVEGQRVIGLRNSSVSSGHRVTRTIYVRAAGRRLPVAESTQGGDSQSRVTLSSWNERVGVSAPRDATPLK
jgi:hypothetical protein